MSVADVFEVEHLDGHECWTYLRATSVGRVAFIGGGQPMIVPINFIVDHGTVVFRTAVDSMLGSASDPYAVAFEADGQLPGTGRVWSVVIQGEATEITGVHAVIDTFGLPLFPWQAGPKGRFVRIIPREVTGRRFPVVAAEHWGTIGVIRPAPLE